jgi:hypothetical protein
MKLTYLTVGALVLLLFALSGAEGADWVLIAKSAGNRTYVDERSIAKTSKDLVRGRVKIERKDPSDPIEEMRAYNEFDCAQEKWRGLALTIQYRNGTTASAPEERRWTAITPGSTDEAVFRRLCRRQ